MLILQENNLTSRVGYLPGTLKVSEDSAYRLWNLPNAALTPFFDFTFLYAN